MIVSVHSRISDLIVHLDELPAEVLLEIVPHIPYSPYGIQCLCLTCGRFNGLVKGYESGLVSSILKTQFQKRACMLFPGLVPRTFADLNLLHRRLRMLDKVHEQWLRIVNHGIELQWLKGRWESIHKAGLLLLYRISDCHDYQAKTEMIQSLPSTSLACILFKLISSIKILRVHGPEPLNASYARDDHLLRSDIELAFEELLLQYGPRLFLTFIKTKNQPSKNWAIDALETEVESMYARQMPYSTGKAKPYTLISSLRRAIAAQLHCEFAQTVTKTWELLSSGMFDAVDDIQLGKLIGGVPITPSGSL